MTTSKEGVEKIDYVVKQWIEKGELELAIETAKLGASTKTIDHLVKACISKKLPYEEVKKRIWERGTWSPYAFLHTALDAAKLGASREVIDSLVKIYVKEKEFLLAGLAAKLGASKEIREFLVEACIKQNWRFEENKLGIRAILVGGRNLTVEEIKKTKTLILE